MTSEILLMNKEAIALAADSAATLNDAKIFRANKIFTLSKYAPVGIMIYGNSAFNNIPWETVIKEFRKKLATQKYDTLQEYADKFIEFLTANNELLTSEDEIYILLTYVNGYFDFITNEIKGKISEQINISKNKTISDDEIMTIVLEIIHRHVLIWENAQFHLNQNSKSVDDFIIKHKKEIDDAFNKKFEKIAQTIKNDSKYSKIYEDILKITACNFLKNTDKINVPGLSGVVIAGFGEKEIFPSFHSFIIWLKIDTCLKYLIGNTGKISLRNMAFIQPFAQGDMVNLFMEGIDPKYQQVINSTIADFFQKYPEYILMSIQNFDEKERENLISSLKIKNDAVFQEFIKKINLYKRENSIQPILDVVTNLPRDELAGMAESLINLTSFKKRVSMTAENVGGPIDVAVITKGDGFIWIKRKQYFKPELNPHFFANYYEDKECSSHSDSK